MPRPRNAVQDPFLLAAALEGLELKKKQIEEQIRTVRSMMGGRPAATSYSAPASKPDASEDAPKATSGRRRELSPAARKRIAAAQKKRWAEFRKQKSAEPAE